MQDINGNYIQSDVELDQPVKLIVHFSSLVHDSLTPPMTVNLKVKLTGHVVSVTKLKGQLIMW